MAGENDKLSAQEKALFREAMADVIQLPQRTAIPNRPKPSAVAAQAERDTRQVLREMMHGELDPAEFESGEELLYVREGDRANLLRDLRLGKFHVQAELDLHRMTRRQAKPAVAEFIVSCKTAGRRCVRIIHGKGNGSFNKEPILKRKLDLWLRQRGDVLAFCSARPVDGGTGAVYVLLAKR
jgi:DNA-nicking Smr family endonuclease